jgi:uncharacterized membrane protein
MIHRDAFREYLRGSLWLLPTLSVLGALTVGSLLSVVNLGADSPFAFQGTPDDARALLIGISGTMVTVIAVLLGLTVVALQLSSTQFSPRLLRNFLRDRPNQVVLSAFVATFAYSAAGLYTVGVSGGNRTTEYPRLAVTGAMVLLFVTLGLLVYFADHLAHSIQIETIMRVVERNALAVIREGLLAGGAAPVPVEDGAVPIAAPHSGYVQAVRVERLLAAARQDQVRVQLRPRVGEHVVAGTTLVWVSPVRAGAPVRAAPAVFRVLDGAVRVGRERTFEQDAAFGIRQLVDVACKAMSPAVNDPYTAVQAIDRLSVLFVALSSRPLGYHLAVDPSGAQVVVPGRRFGDYLATMCGLVRRYGAGEPIVSAALLRLLASCAAVEGPDPDRMAVIEGQARIVVEDAEREVRQPADLAVVHAEAAAVRAAVARQAPRGSGPASALLGDSEDG